MYGIFGMIAWVLVMVLALTWLFLPWIIIAKMDEVVGELRTISQLLAKNK